MTLALIILVSTIAIAGIVYFGIRYSAAIAEKKKIEEEERRKREKEEKEGLIKQKTELKMHQEEVVLMAKNDPETVARIIKNWLT